MDLNNNDYNRGGRNPRKVRQVRRHDNPDPRPVSDPFNVPEERTTTLEEDERLPYYEPTPKPRRGKSEPEKVSDDRDEVESKPRRRITRREPGIVRFFKDRRLRVFTGVLCIIIASVMCITLVSHLRTAAADQSQVLNQTVEEMAKHPETVQNAAGPFGAWLSHVLLTDSLGLGAFVIVIYLFAIGGCLVARWKIRFWAFTFKCLLLAITVSVVTGLVTYSADSAVWLGGTHGHYVNAYLFSMADWIGPIVVSLILLVATVCVFYYPIAAFCKKCKDALSKRVKSDESEEWSVESRESNAESLESKVEGRKSNDESGESSSRSALAPTKNVEREEEGGEAFMAADNVFGIDDDVENNGEEPVAPKAETQKEDGFSIDDKDEPVVIENNGDEEVQAPLEMQVERNEIEVDETLAAGEGFTVDGIDGETQPDFDPHAELPNFEMPPLDLLEERPATHSVDTDELEENKQRITRTLSNYGIEIKSVKAIVGPTITLYEIVPVDGTRIRTIKSLEDDIAMSLAAKGIRIIAPLPGKSAVGIEVPNKEPQTVSMRSVLESKRFSDFDKPLPIAMGATISNDVFCLDVSSMPHALVAGATGMGKSVGLNAIIASLLFKKHPADLKFVLVDPKMVEFSLYAKLENHYLAKLPNEEDAIVTDSSKVLPMLQSLCVEMDDRYALLKDAGVRDIKEYNKRFIKRRLNPADGHRYLPYIVVIIDEFADLIMMGRKEIETPVTRITQKARAVGIHMIIATQRPSTNVLTGLIKANCPSRIAFRVNQMVDSRTILDCPGANQLIGRGDMLYSAGNAMERLQCAFISTDEVERICDFINRQPGFYEPYYLPDPALASGADALANAGAHIASGGMDRDPLFDDCARFLVSQPNASTSILQRRFEIGYNRAGKIIDQLEAAGIVGPPSGNKPRAVLVDSVTLESILSQG